jgi:hypothetical protein
MGHTPTNAKFHPLVARRTNDEILSAKGGQSTRDLFLTLPRTPLKEKSFLVSKIYLLMPALSIEPFLLFYYLCVRVYIALLCYTLQFYYQDTTWIQKVSFRLVPIDEIKT